MSAAGKIGLKMISFAVGIPVGIATKKAVERTWTLIRPEDPPRKPSEQDVAWSDAIAWAALSAVGIVLADLVTRRASEAAYTAITGNVPPAPKAGKDAKKLAKTSEGARTTAD